LAAEYLSSPESKSGPSRDGPFEFNVKDEKLRQAMPAVAAEIEAELGSSLLDLYLDKYRHEYYYLGSDMRSVVDYQARLERAIESGTGEPALSAVRAQVARYGIDPDVFREEHAVFGGGRIYDWTDTVSSAIRTLHDGVLTARRLGDFGKQGFRIDGLISVNLRQKHDGSLACRSRLSAGDTSAFNGKPLPECAHRIAESVVPWSGLRWPEYFASVEACQAGMQLDTVKTTLRKEFSSLFPGDEDSLLIWCDFTERLYYVIEARRVTTNREMLGIVSDPVSSGMSPALRRWVAEEAARRGVRMVDVLEEALDQARRSASLTILLRPLIDREDELAALVQAVVASLKANQDAELAAILHELEVEIGRRNKRTRSAIQRQLKRSVGKQVTIEALRGVLEAIRQ
jgi:hypothetical protein